jgi:hypothetical protein
MLHFRDISYTGVGLPTKAVRITEDRLSKGVIKAILSYGLLTEELYLYEEDLYIGHYPLGSIICFVFKYTISEP